MAFISAEDSIILRKHLEGLDTNNPESFLGDLSSKEKKEIENLFIELDSIDDNSNIILSKKLKSFLLEKTKTEVNKLIEDAKLKQAITSLDENNFLFLHFEQIQIKTLLFRYNELTKNHLENTISPEAFNLERNRIVSGILKVLSSKKKSRFHILYLTYKPVMLSFLKTYKVFFFVAAISIPIFFIGRYYYQQRLVDFFDKEIFLSCPEGTDVWVVIEGTPLPSKVDASGHFVLQIPYCTKKKIKGARLYYGKQEKDCSVWIQKKNSRNIGRDEGCDC